MFAALDLGTNNCRLLVAEGLADGSLKVVESYSEFVRLGEGIVKTPYFQEEAILRTLHALKECSYILSRYKLKQFRAVATQACRLAHNTEAFVKRAYQETGIQLEIISAEEEAKLSLLSCYDLMNADKPYSIVFDIGGGSTEVIFGKYQKHNLVLKDYVSIPFGVVNLTELYGETMPEDMFDTFYNDLSILEQKYRISQHIEDITFIGNAGTVTTLSAVALKLTRYDRSKIDGVTFLTKDIETTTEHVLAMTLESRAAHPCIGQGRYDLIVAGCFILKAIFDFWDIKHLVVADRGLREGIIRNLMRKK